MIYTDLQVTTSNVQKGFTVHLGSVDAFIICQEKEGLYKNIKESFGMYLEREKPKIKQ